MADINSLVEYQKVDIELFKVNEEIDSYEFTKKMIQAKREFAQAKSQVAESESEAAAIIEFYNKAMKYFEETAKKVGVLSSKLEELPEDEEKDRKEITGDIEVLRDKLNELEKELTAKRAKSEVVIRAYLDSQDRGKKLREIYQNAKAKAEEFRAKKEPAINELNKKLEAMQANIDKQIFELYKTLTNEKKYPALVEAATMDNGKNYSCNGCGLELSQKVKGELIEKNICRCENCRRIIYKK